MKCVVLSITPHYLMLIVLILKTKIRTCLILD